MVKLCSTIRYHVEVRKCHFLSLSIVEFCIVTYTQKFNETVHIDKNHRSCQHCSHCTFVRISTFIRNNENQKSILIQPTLKFKQVLMPVPCTVQYHTVSLPFHFLPFSLRLFVISFIFGKICVRYGMVQYGTSFFSNEHICG